jgi:hypothetical protein
LKCIVGGKVEVSKHSSLRATQAKSQEDGRRAADFSGLALVAVGELKWGTMGFNVVCKLKVCESQAIVCIGGPFDF